MFGLVLVFLVDLALRAALRSPKGGAFRAKRRAGSTSPAEAPPLAALSVALLLALLPSTDDSLLARVAPRPASRAAVVRCVSLPRFLAGLAPRFRRIATPVRDTRS